MKFIYLTDIHIRGTSPINRTDVYTFSILNKLREIGTVIKQKRIDFILCGGDLFDLPSVSNKLLCSVADIFKSYKVPILVIPGNHDIVGQNIDTLEHTSLGILASTGVIHLLSRNNSPKVLRKTNDKVSITGQEFTPDLDSLITKDTDYLITRDETALNILVSHSMVVDKPFIGNFTLIDELNSNADLLLTGHYHPDRFEKKVNNTLVLKPRAVGRKDATVHNMTYKPEYIILTVKGKELINYEFCSFECARLDVFKEVQNTNENIEQFTTLIEELDRDKWKSFDVKNMIRNIAREMHIDKNIIDMAFDEITQASLEIKEEDFFNDFIPINGNQYITSVDITNFQSHSHTSINLDKGLNALIGASHCGKTAIIRAIVWCLYNEPRGTDFIKEGSKTTKVKVIFNTGNSIERVRSHTENYYLVNGKKLTGFGTNLPIDVINASQMPKYKIGKNLCSINFSSQLEQPFLLSLSTGDRATSIGSITHTDIIDSSVINISKNINSMQRDNKKYQDELKELDIELSKFSSLQEEKQLIIDTEQKLLKIDELSNEMNLIFEFISKKKEIQNNLNKINQKIALFSTDIDIQRMEEIRDILLLAKRHEIVKNNISLCVSIPCDINTKELDRLYSEYLEIKTLNYNYQKTTLDLARVPHYNELNLDIHFIENKLKEVNYIEETLNKRNNLINAISSIKEKKLDIDTDTIQKLYEECKFLYMTIKEVNTIKDKIKEIDEETIILNKHKAELILKYKELIKECKICPTCGREFGEHYADEHLELIN